MTDPIILRFVFAAGLLATASPVAAAPGEPPDAIAREVEALARRAVVAGLTPALGVAVVKEGRVVLESAHGLADGSRGIPADAKTLWYVASTSKAFTGFATALLARRGVLPWDAPITGLVPRARWHPEARPRELTLARFLSHTHHLNSGAVVVNAAFTGAIPEARWPELLVTATPTGSRDLVYSNLGYNVAAMAIDAIRPEGWKRFLEEAVFAPAGMRETHARVSGLDARRLARPHDLRPDGTWMTARFLKTDATMNAAGGHLATLGDLARWALVQMDGGVIEGRRVFPAEAVALGQRLLAPQTREPARTFAWFQREGWAAGWDLGRYEGEPMVSRFGSYHTLRSHLSFLPGRRIGVVAQANGQPGWAVTDLLAAFAYDLDAGRPDARERAERHFAELVGQRDRALERAAAEGEARAGRLRQPWPRPAADFSGRFEQPSFGTLEILAGDGRLSFAWGVLRGELEPHDLARGQLRLSLAGMPVVVNFRFDGPGPAHALEVQGTVFTRAP